MPEPSPPILATPLASIYHDPDTARWLGSFEGVPDEWVQSVAKPAPPPAPAGAVGRALADLGVWLPGLVLAAGVGLAGEALSTLVGETLLGFAKTPISGLMLAIVIGLLLSNLIAIPPVYTAGIRFCVKTVLRLGVALLGIRLSLLAAGSIGLVALPIVAGCVATALVAATGVGRLLGLPPRLGTLIAVGTGVCGVSAIVATASSIDADEDEISYAAATITLFGIAAMFLYPFLGHLLFEATPERVGYFLGTAIHDTSQVTGAGLMYQQQFDAPAALDVAVVTKLMRNLSLILVVPGMAYLYRRQGVEGGASGPGQMGWRNVLPLFVVGFVVLTLLRTLGDAAAGPAGPLPADAWDATLSAAQWLANACLMAAMAGIGLSTHLDRLLHLGIKPFIAGLLAAGLVGVVSVLLVTFLG